jgi:hypothetical protein
LAQSGYSLLVGEIASAVSTAKPFAEVQVTLKQISAQHRVPADKMRDAIKEGWAKAADRIGISEPLDVHRHSAMAHFYEEAGIAGKELANTDGFKTATTSLMLWCTMTGNPLPTDHPHPFTVDRDEIPLVFFGSVVYSHKIGTRAYGKNNLGASTPCGFGRYYPYTSFMAERADIAVLKEIDYGGMLFTTNNIYFGGEYKSFRIPYEGLVKLRPFADSLEVSRDGAGVAV